MTPPTAPQRPLDLPAFYCPVPPALHPRAAEIDARSVQWMTDMGLREPGSWLTKVDAGRFIALCMPYCCDSTIDVMVDLNYWGFAWDDELDENPRLQRSSELAQHIARLSRIVEAPEPKAPPTDLYGRALRDICLRLADFPDQAQVARVTDGLRRFFLGVLWRVSNQERGEIPGLNDYLVMRMNDDGGPWLMPYTVLGGGYRLTAAEANSPVARALSEMIALIAGLDNDLLSYHRDGQFHQNILDVLRNERGLSLQDAVTEAVALRDRIMSLYLRTCDRTTKGGSPQLRRFAEDLGSWVRGNIEWSARTYRYVNLHDPATGTDTPAAPLDLTWSTHPADPTTAPPPLPGIAWWWEQG